MLTNINILFYLAAYFIGGIPFGLLLAKMFCKTDIRELGSGSIGATNVLRVVKEKNPKLAKKLAICTVILDMLKAVLPILIASALSLSLQTQWAIGVLAVIGHCFSPYLKFEGGKGVATSAAVLGYFMPLALVLALFVWFILGRTLRISSVSSLGALAGFIIASFIFYPNVEVINTHAPVIIISFIIVYKHWSNILRLIVGKEKAVI